MTPLAATPYWLNASIPKGFRAGRPQSSGSGCLHASPCGVASAGFALEGTPAKPATLIGCFVEEKHAIRHVSLSPRSYLRTTLAGRSTPIRVAGCVGVRGCTPQKLTGGWGPLPVGSALGSPRPPATRWGECAFGASALSAFAHPATNCMPFGMPWSRAAPKKQKRASRSVRGTFGGRASLSRLRCS